jgi:hypothetical protein
MRRLQELKVPTGSHKSALSSNFDGTDELNRNRTIPLPKLVANHASAEFFVLLAPGPKVEDTKFISGSEQLQSAGNALLHAHFTQIAFPVNSSGRLPRRGILARYPNIGCSFVLMPTEFTREARSNFLRTSLLFGLAFGDDGGSEAIAKVVWKLVELRVAVDFDGFLGGIADNVAVVAPS